MPSRSMGKKGLVTFYADESDDKQTFAMAFVCVPTLEIPPTPARIAWDHHLKSVKLWRKKLYEKFGVPISKELKGSKIATGRNRYWRGKSSIYGTQAFDLYAYALENLDFLPDASVFSVTADKEYELYGHTRLEAVLYAAFQRMQRACADQVSAFVFCDEGHAEYRKLYRRACVHLPTGSSQGAWDGGEKARNMPLVCALKDLNFKESRSSHFIQIADLVAYATLLKRRAERSVLSEKEKGLGFGAIHDLIPRRVLNARVDRNSKDGIKRLK